jgi:beta-glucosidase
MSKDYTLPYRRIEAREPSSQSELLNGAMEGHVLVKNVYRTLPLKKSNLLSVFGYDAVAPPAMDVMPSANS